MKSTTIAVRDALKLHPEARFDAARAILAVWEADGLVLTAHQRQAIDRLTNPRTIIRTLARLQNQYGLYRR